MTEGNMVTETIKGQAYRLIKLDPIAGGRLATQVGQILAVAAGDVETIKSLIQSHIDNSKEAPELAEGEQAKSQLEKLLEAPQLLSAMAGGIAKIDADALYDMGLKCIRNQLFADRKLHDDMALNQWFESRPDHLLLVMAWALKVNCQGFFGFGGRG
jgi:hypothetical protein